MKILEGKDIKPRIKYDPEKLRYNEYYQSVDFWKKKFPKGYDQIPGFDKIIERNADYARLRNLTPEKEMTERSKIISNDNIYVNGNIEHSS
jgi:hypothetical protein